jgi:hypothetical protein
MRRHSTPIVVCGFRYHDLATLHTAHEKVKNDIQLLGRTAPRVQMLIALSAAEWEQVKSSVPRHDIPKHRVDQP